jgi:DNA-binding NarL/FixJ family response regulator
MGARHEDSHLEVAVPVAEVFAAGSSPEELQMVQGFLQLLLANTAQRTVDEDVRVRWLRSPSGQEMVRLAGSMEAMAMRPGRAEGEEDLADPDVELLRLLTEGLTNKEIADRLGTAEEAVTRRLSEMFARIGASSRAEATAFAFRQGVS